jgi:DHA1 family inner membrane transport protein
MALAAQTKNRDRVFGWWTVGQITLGAVGLAVFPRFFDSLGISVVYLTLAVLMALSLPLLRFLPTHPATPSPIGGQDSTLAKPNLAKTITALVACLLFYVGLISIWTFTGGIAAEAGIDPQTTSMILSIATVTGVVGSFAATLVGGTLNRRFTLLGGYCAMVLAVAMLFGVDNALRFGAAALIFKFAWPWTLPFLMSTLADLDRMGRATNLANLFIGGGLAIGPFIAGRLVEATGGYGALVLLSCPVVLVSLALILAAQPSARERGGDAVVAERAAVSH